MATAVESLSSVTSSYTQSMADSSSLVDDGSEERAVPSATLSDDPKAEQSSGSTSPVSKKDKDYVPGSTDAMPVDPSTENAEATIELKPSKPKKRKRVVDPEEEADRTKKLLESSDLYGFDDEDEAEYAAKRRELMDKLPPPPPKRRKSTKKIKFSDDKSDHSDDSEDDKDTRDLLTKLATFGDDPTRGDGKKKKKKARKPKDPRAQRAALIEREQFLVDAAQARLQRENSIKTIKSRPTMKIDMSDFLKTIKDQKATSGRGNNAGENVIHAFLPQQQGQDDDEAQAEEEADDGEDLLLEISGEDEDDNMDVDSTARETADKEKTKADPSAGESQKAKHLDLHLTQSQTQTTTDPREESEETAWPTLAPIGAEMPPPKPGVVTFGRKKLAQSTQSAQSSHSAPATSGESQGGGSQSQPQSQASLPATQPLDSQDIDEEPKGAQAKGEAKVDLSDVFNADDDENEVDIKKLEAKRREEESERLEKEARRLARGELRERRQQERRARKEQELAEEAEELESELQLSKQNRQKRREEQAAEIDVSDDDEGSNLASDTSLNTGVAKATTPSDEPAVNSDDDDDPDSQKAAHDKLLAKVQREHQLASSRGSESFLDFDQDSQDLLQLIGKSKLKSSQLPASQNPSLYSDEAARDGFNQADFLRESKKYLAPLSSVRGSNSLSGFVFLNSNSNDGSNLEAPGGSNSRDASRGGLNRNASAAAAPSPASPQAKAKRAGGGGAKKGAAKAKTQQETSLFAMLNKSK